MVLLKAHTMKFMEGDGNAGLILTFQVYAFVL